MPRSMYLVSAFMLLTPFSVAGCGTLIGLEDLERANCAGACADGEPDSRASPTGGRSGSTAGSDPHSSIGGALGAAGTCAVQTAPGGATNNDAAGRPNGDTADNGTAGTNNAGTNNAGTTSGSASGGNGGTDPGTTAGGPSTGGTELGSAVVGGGAGAAGQSPSSGGGTAIALPIRINFQPLGAAVPAGYVPDTGLIFAARNGLSFGWNFDHTDVTRDRGVNSSPLLDTLCQFHVGGIWELELPNGTYSVLASIGDASNPSIYTLLVEGVIYWVARPIGANQFLSNTRVITITDGRLTLSQGLAVGLATRINYVEISAP